MKSKPLIVVLALVFAVSAVPDTATAKCPRGLKVKKVKCTPEGKMKLRIWCSREVERATISVNGCALTEKPLRNRLAKFVLKGLEPGEYTVTVEGAKSEQRWEKVITCG